MSRVKISEKLLRQQKIPKSCIFNIWHLDNCTLEPNNSFRFPKVLNDIFQIHLNIFFQTVPVFCCCCCCCCCHLQKIKKKKNHLWHFHDHISGSTHDANNPIFLSTLWALSVCIFHFCISRPSKFSSLPSSLLDYDLICKIHIYIKPININTHCLLQIC